MSTRRRSKPVLPGQRASRSADGAWLQELARVRALTPWQRMAEAFELGDDEFAMTVTEQAPSSGGR